MKPPIIVASWLNVNGMALFPFILVKRKADKQNNFLINHERIHLRQQLELLVVPFYILYLINYLVNLAYYKNHDKAYRAIVFEHEAYTHESNLAYLKKRGFWAWITH